LAPLRSGPRLRPSGFPELRTGRGLGGLHHRRLITARNRQIVQHRQWMIRSYAVTFTFVSSRVLNLWPRYWSHLGDSLSAVGVIGFTLASLLIVDLGLNWRELTTRRV